MPKNWNEAIIIPIHKKGDKTNSENFCGILFLAFAADLNILGSSIADTERVAQVLEQATSKMV